MKNYTFILFLTLLFSACGDVETNQINSLSNSADLDTNIYYGDIKNNQILNIDIKTMKLVSVQKSDGDYPYEITNGYDDKLLVINRHDTNINILENDKLTESINLQFSPRSIELNKETKLALVSSSSEPSASFLKKGSLIYKDSSYVKPISYGGENATGHPIWINDSYFLLLDRTESTIELYHAGNSKSIQKLKTSSSVHHIIESDGIYYGSMEGIRGKTSPGIIKFKIAYENFTEVKEQLISDFNLELKDFNSKNWGFHHFALHPDKKHIYVGSYEGNVFVLDTKDLSFVDTFKAGKGAGHFLFYEDKLIITNHYDLFKSIYDVNNPEKNLFLKNIYFSKYELKNKIRQSHTSHIVDGFLYFMFNNDDKCTLYKIDLNDFSISGFLDFKDSYCVMGALKSRINSAFSDM